MDIGALIGAGIGFTNAIVNSAKGMKQVKDGKNLQKKLDAQGRPILETPEAFNEVEGLVRSNYLDPRLLGETRIKDEIKARESNQIQNIQDTASSGADALMAYNVANLNTDKSLFNVDMKAYEQQRADYSALLSMLGQKAGYQEKQFDANIMQPFIQDAEQAKALIAAGEQNRSNGMDAAAGYAASATGGAQPGKSGFASGNATTNTDANNNANNNANMNKEKEEQDAIDMNNYMNMLKMFEKKGNGMQTGMAGGGYNF